MKLDIGCGKHPRNGYIGVDVRDFGQPIIADLREPWKWEDESVEAVFSSHFVEHLTALERIHFVNELYRVLIPGGLVELITPDWCHERAYGDLTHQWPPVTSFWFHYLSREWREENAPHMCDMYTCNFVTTSGPKLAEWVGVRNWEFQQFAALAYKNANEDLVATLKKV